VSKTIWKFAIKPSVNIYMLPAKAKILSVGLQENGPQFWAEVDPDAPVTSRCLAAIPTGGEIPNKADYLGTIHGIDGWMVFHIYELHATEKGVSHD
jgi:hypothetical protein